jgi:hypothetical protein
MAIKKALLTGLGNAYSQTNTFPSFEMDGNISRLSDRLVLKHWDNIDLIRERNVTKNNIINSFNEIVNGPIKPDVLLFYFCGHGYTLGSGYYFVNYDYTMFRNNDFTDPASGFFSDQDYEEIIGNALSNNPQLCIISIIDCCYAGGIVQKVITNNNLNNRHIAFCAVNKEAESKIDVNHGSEFNISLCEGAGLTHTNTELRVETTLLLNGIQTPFFNIPFVLDNKEHYL